jgi:hypothetical protein
MRNLMKVCSNNNWLNWSIIIVTSIYQWYQFLDQPKTMSKFISIPLKDY